MLGTGGKKIQGFLQKLIFRKPLMWTRMKGRTGRQSGLILKVTVAGLPSVI